MQVALRIGKPSQVIGSTIMQEISLLLSVVQPSAAKLSNYETELILQIMLTAVPLVLKIVRECV